MWSLTSSGCSADNGTNSENTEEPEESNKHVAADIAPLNALLAAEYQAVAAYEGGKGLITQAAETDPLAPLSETILEIASSIQEHHRKHAAALREALAQLGGVPVSESEATEGLAFPELLLESPTIDNVLRFAAGAERAAAIAYNQVVGQLEASTYRYLAGSILGDETEHFIVLAALILGLAGPGPELDSSTAGGLIPTAFISEVDGADGLKEQVRDYFS